MSSLGAILNSAVTSMQASQLGIAIGSNNISNAQNPEYTRQRLITAPGASLESRISIGSGVDVVRIEALRNRMIESRRLQETSSQAGADLLHRTLSDIEVQFSDTDTSGLMQSLSKFFNSFQTLSTDPASPNFRQQVRTNAQSLMTQFRTLHDNLANAKTLLDRSIAEKVSTVNSLARQIAHVSGQIADQETNGPANDLRDQRAELVKQLSGIVDVNELETDDKFYQLTIGNNRLLVFGTDTAPLGTQEDLPAMFNSGEIHSAIDARDNYIPRYMDALDEMAYEIVRQVNSKHSAGYDLNGNKGIDFFQPMGGSADASALMSLSSAVAGSASKIAASGASDGNDNRVAAQIGNLLFQPVFTGGSVSDQYRNLVFNVGSDVSNAQLNLNQHEAMARQLELRRQSMSGVSIDEETVQILQFQRAYQASARLIKTVDELTQTILGI